MKVPPRRPSVRLSVAAALLALPALVSSVGCQGPSVSATVPNPANDVAVLAKDERIRDLENQLEGERRARADREARLNSLHAELQQARADAAGARNADQSREYQARIAELQRRLDEAARTPAPAAPPADSPLPPDATALLRKLARENGLSFDERRAMLRFPGDPLFASGSDQVTPQGVTVLRKLQPIIDRPELRAYRIRVVGHTDKRPISQPATAKKFPTNLHLSTGRAVAVVAELIQMGKSRARTPSELEALKHRFEAVGRGQWEPLDNGNTEEAHRRNRRVEIFLVPPGSPSTTLAAGK